MEIATAEKPNSLPFLTNDENPILNGQVCYSCLKWGGRGNGVPRACNKCRGRYVGKAMVDLTNHVLQLDLD